MVLREWDEENLMALEKAVRNMLSTSRGKRPEEILNNQEALADYISDAYFVIRAIEPTNRQRFLSICEILSAKYNKRDISACFKKQLGAQMIDA